MTNIHHPRVLSTIALVVSGLIGAWTPAPPAGAPTRGIHVAGAGALFGRLPISFERNQGQAPGDVLFLARTGRDDLAFTRTGVRVGRTHPIRLRFLGLNPGVRVTGAGKLPGLVNYFIGIVPARWRVDIPTFRRVLYRNLYPGIDLLYTGNRSSVEARWVLAPGADLSRISLELRGASHLRVRRDGSVLASLPGRAFTLGSPRAFQTRGGLRRMVPVRFLVGAGGLVSLRAGAYDRARPLVIDPTLAYATNLGGSSSDFAGGIAVDRAGNSYVTGSTSSPDFPAVHAVQPREPGTTDQEDAFVSELNPSGTALLFSTYLGGNNDEDGAAIARGSGGAVYVTGFTRSANFPQRHALKQQHGGCNRLGPTGDAFVVKLGPRGDRLLAGTCLGGSAADWGTGIALAPSGAALIVGSTGSSNFPTVHPLQARRAGSLDAFVARLSPSGSTLTYSTYLGGTGADTAAGIALDAAGAAYVAGSTDSPRFPRRLPLLRAGGVNAFVVKLDPAGRHLIYVREVGGTGADTGLSVAVDARGAAYVVGSTDSTDFPTVHPLQSLPGGGTDGFVTIISPDGQTLDFSSYLGGRGNDAAAAVAVDPLGRVHLTGSTASPDFPLSHPLQPAYAGGYFYGDAFAAELAVDGRSLLYSTYLGGTGDDVGRALAVDARGDTYIAGGTSSADFPVTAEVGGGRPARGNAFVVRVLDNLS